MTSFHSRGERGFTLVETVMTLFIFGLFLWVIVLITSDMRTWQQRMTINYLAHPQVNAVMARLRRDVLSATAPYYGSDQSATRLDVYSLQESGFAQTVVYDFSTRGEVHRRAYSAGAEVSHWVARGVPAQFEISTFEIPGRPFGVRMRARDEDGYLVIDQVLQPRAH